MQGAQRKTDMRWLQGGLLLLILLLQYRFWFAENGFLEQRRLAKELAALQVELEAQRAKNDYLQAKVDDLKSGNDAVEELARQNLGLIKPDEVFIFITEDF